MTEEGRIQHEIIVYCRAKGYVVIRHNAVKITGKGIFVKLKPQDAGVTDLIVATPFGVIFIEVKVPGKDLELAQKAFKKAILGVNQRHITAWSLKEVSDLI